MKQLVTSYTFTAAAKTIDSADFTSLDGILLITNVTDNIIIYNFADPAKGGSLTGTTLTLTYDTTAMSNTDNLQIFIENGSLIQPVSGTVAATQSGSWAITGISGTVSLPTGAATEASLSNRLSEADFDTKVGILTETPPATDIASSGLNGRLQRIAQRLSSLITAVGSPFQAGGSIGNTAFSVNNASGASAVNIQDGGNSLTVDGSVTVSQATGTDLHTVIDSGTITTLTGITNVVHVDDNSGTLTVDNNGTFAVQATDSGSGKTLKRAVVSLTASGNLISAVSNKVLKVYALSMQSQNNTMTVQFTDGNGGGALDQVWSFNTGEGVMLSAVNPPSYLFKTSVTTALYVVITGTGTIKMACSYWDDDAS
jgi:hypothetical protein